MQILKYKVENLSNACHSRRKFIIKHSAKLLFFSHYSYIILVAIQDEGSRHVRPALDVLRKIGAKDPILLGNQGSFALAGYAQVNKPSWVTQAQQDAAKGPSEIHIKIPRKLPRKNVLNESLLIFRNYVDGYLPFGTWSHSHLAISVSNYLNR